LRFSPLSFSVLHPPDQIFLLFLTRRMLANVESLASSRIRPLIPLATPRLHDRGIVVPPVLSSCFALQSSGKCKISSFSILKSGTYTREPPPAALFLTSLPPPSKIFLAAVGRPTPPPVSLKLDPFWSPFRLCPDPHVLPHSKDLFQKCRLPTP